jgi:hypothetical protein
MGNDGGGAGRLRQTSPVERRYDEIERLVLREDEAGRARDSQAVVATRERLNAAYDAQSADRAARPTRTNQLIAVSPSVRPATMSDAELDAAAARATVVRAITYRDNALYPLRRSLANHAAIQREYGRRDADRMHREDGWSTNEHGDMTFMVRRGGRMGETTQWPASYAITRTADGWHVERQMPGRRLQASSPPTGTFARSPVARRIQWDRADLGTYRTPGAARRAAVEEHRSVTRAIVGEFDRLARRHPFSV